MSTSSAGLAVKLGYTNIKVMLAGVPGWKKAGNHVVASDEFVKKGNIVLVDLRSSKEYEAGHIPRAHNIPMEDIEYAEYELPYSTVAPIVVYGNGDDAKKAYKMIKGWGYKKSSLAGMDFAAWKKAGGPVETGVTPEEIVWKRVLGKHEISIAEFVKSADGADDTLIVDVRTKDEAAAGKFATARHIPLDEIQNQLESLPKDKEMLIHCTTGARAEMAATELRNAGFKSRYLVANVECDGADCEVSE
ncbi:MAG: rhodanese-like domain-containing protein [Desulfurivibrionaceae bacterium]|nr:rhodanese-like domain-containing protein [Desulfurivibrionaceae bacterium]